MPKAWKKSARAIRPDGRSVSSKHFAGVPDRVWDHPKFQRLPSNAKVVIFAITRRNFARNNGQIAFAVRDGEALGLGRDATARALREAEAAGFIAAVTRGTFTSKRLATEWAVTWQKVGKEPATDAYRVAEPEIKHSPAGRTTQSGWTDTKGPSASLQSVQTA